MAKRIPGPRSLLLGPQQWQAIRHPARQDLALALEAMAPCSVADLAAAIDRPAAALYRHMEKLVKAGFAMPAGRRAAGRRWTALYACGPFLNMTARHFDARSGRGLREHGELVASLMKAAARDYARAARAMKGSPQREVEAVLSSMVERTRFDDRQLRRFKRLARDMYELIREGRRTGRGRRYQVSLTASPMA
jgi:predicted ArsR family transcriptional regulator